MSTASILGNVQEMDPEEQRQALLGYLRPSQGIAPPVTSGAAAGLKLPAVGPSTLKSPTQRDSSPGNAQIPAKRVLGTLEGDQQNRSDLMNQSPGVMNIAHKIESSKFGQNHPTMGKILGWGAQVPAMIANTAIGATPIGHLALSQIPGTSAHQQLGIYRANQALTQDVDNAQKEAQTANEQAQPELAAAKNELAQNKQLETAQHHSQQIESSLNEHGFTMGEDGKVVPLPYERLSEPQQAVHDLKASQEELADATAALRKAQADPNGPQARMAQQRIEGAQQSRQIALQRLGLSQQIFDARYKGTDGSGQPLAGAMIADDGRPVGSSFSQNVRPTGTERNKGDMAGSAREQLTDILKIVHNRPDVFGPAAGRKTDFTVWLGSQDPDAQRFRAARTIAGDHLAGTFGGRSETALASLDSAIGHFKDNPAAVDAGVNQLIKANERFLKAGSVRTAGSNVNAQTQPQGGGSGLGVNLKDAMAFPQNKGKSEADVRKEIEAHGYKVVE